MTESTSQKNPIVEAFELLAKNMIAGDDALFTLCNALVIRVNELSRELSELHTQMDILMFHQDMKSGTKN